ncbi:phosphotransferase [Actinomadura syzygii]|uniref:phosphotransferase n=1 Tax=Actinomadura syzygii TaxID=1427538 RepID=UPI00361E8E75
MLTHFDFWSGNVLWDGDALTGVIDWAVETWWPNYHDLGRTDLTPQALRTLHTSWTQRGLRRWNQLNTQR